jgi:molybdate transport system ATP-binding protein
MSFDISVRHRVGAKDIVLDAYSDAPLTALCGPSGVGKTSILNMISGLLRPDSGSIIVGGVTLFDDEKRIDLPPEKRRVGYVFQDNRLFPHVRVAANLAFGERLSRPDDRWISQAEVVEFLGIAALLDRWPASLSGGEARRVAIGRALLSAPRFLLLDEPLTSLDSARSEEILRVIERIRDELSVPILYVSHQPAEVARLTDRQFSLS